jgi:hypothetical protein
MWGCGLDSFVSGHPRAVELVNKKMNRQIPQWEGKSWTDRAKVSSWRRTVLPAVSTHAEEMFYQNRLSRLFVHSIKWNALSSISRVCFRSSYSNNIGRSCYGFQINSPKGPEENLTDYVSLLKLLLFIPAYTTSIQLLPYICSMLSTQEFRVSKVAETMPTFSRCYLQLDDMRETDANHL